MHEIGYKWKAIVPMFVVSRWTLFRRVKKLGLESITELNNVSGEELDFKELHGPAVGRSLAMCYMRQSGLRVQHERVGKALVRVDSENY